MIRVLDMRFIMELITVIVISFSLWGCTSGNGKQSSVQKKTIFTQPDIPPLITNPQERIAYVVTHYWDHFNFADTTLAGNAEMTEQAFVNYLSLLPNTTMDVVEKSVSEMIGKAITTGNATFDHFAALYEKYLYDPNSPFRQEDYYIVVLRCIIANDKVDEQQKIRPRYQLGMALKNRPGTIAADFTITLHNGRTIKLSAITAEYTLLFFNNPDCHDCARVKQVLGKLSDTRIKVVAVYPDEDPALWRQTKYPPDWINGYDAGQVISNGQLYDLKAIPTLYLLDRQKRVILKDAVAEQIPGWLQRQSDLLPP